MGVTWVGGSLNIIFRIEMIIWEIKKVNKDIGKMC